MPSTTQRHRRGQDRESIQLRKLRGELQRRGITSTCELSLRIDTVNEAERTVVATIVTDAPVLVPDWERGEMVDEILVIEGMRAAPSVPLLENHYRWSLDDQIGGVDEIRAVPGAGEVTARLHYSDFGTADDYGRRQERIWQRVRERTARSVSAGYRVIDAVYLRAGESKEINGRRYTAGGRTLKVSTSWFLREVSMVPIGADPSALIRAFHQGGELPMPQSVTNPAGETRGEQPAVPAKELKQDDFATIAVRQLAPGEMLVSAPGEKPINVDQAGIRAERERVVAIEQLCREYPEHDTIRQQAIAEGWTHDRTAAHLLAAVRAARPNPVERQAPAIHSTSHEERVTADTLSMVVAHKLGVRVDSASLSRCRDSHDLRGVFRCDVNDERRQKAMDAAFPMRGMSLYDIACEAVRMAGGRHTYDKGEMMKRAFSTAELGDIFTNSLGAAVLVGYIDTPDSTLQWTTERDVSNFLTQERIGMGKFGRLKQLQPNGTAEDLDAAADKEEYKVKRYAGKFSMDERDFINDTLGATDQLAPVDMGAAARQVRPDLVYSIILANASMRDGVALFHANHGNVLTGSALTTLTIGNMLQLLMKQRINGRPQQLRLRHLLVPADLLIPAENATKSQRRADTTAGAGDENIISRYGFNVIADDRLGVAGVTNPDGEASLAGSATTWYGACTPGENGAKTIEVGYVAATGRMPRVRGYQLTEGRFGYGWDVTLDIGAKSIDWRGMARATA